MDKVLTTILLMVAAVVCVTLVVNAVYPAISRSTSALSSASARMNERIRSQIEIVHASAELDKDGVWQDTDSDTYFDIFAWVKNVGSGSIVDIEQSDVLVGGNQTIWSWIPHVDHASGAYPQWDYTIENGTEWSTSTTLKIEISYESALTSGEYSLKVLTPNGISDDHVFSM